MCGVIVKLREKEMDQTETRKHAQGGPESKKPNGTKNISNGLTKRIDREITSFAMDDPASLDNALTSV